MSVPMPADEPERLRALRALRVLDTPPEPAFDAIVKLASRIGEMPISLLSLVDRDRQWFKANVGLEGITATPRDVAFCAHAIVGEESMIVPDALADPRFRDNPLVRSEPFLRFYAGAPLISSNGHALGTLCVLDRVPRQLPEERRQSLCDLSKIAAMMLELRRDRLDLQAAREQAANRAQQLRTLIDALPVMIAYVGLDERYELVNATFEKWSNQHAASAVGRSLRQMFPPALYPVAHANFGRALRGETVTFDELWSGPVVRDVQITLTPDRDPAGAVRGVFAVDSDISGRVRDEALRREQQLRAMNAQLHDEIEAERKQLSRTLHDQCGQELTAVRMQLARLTTAAAALPGLAPVVAQIDASVAAAAASMHATVSGLRPALLDDLGLVPAMRRLAADVEAASGVAVDLTVEGELKAIEDPQATTLFRVLQEALTNVQKHAAATEAWVRLTGDVERITLRIEDNGRGFDPARVRSGALGLVGMRERAQEFGGRLQITDRAGGGTIVTLELPRFRA